VLTADRPPLWVLSALLLLGGAHLAGTAAAPPPSPTERLAVSTGALLAAALAKALLLAWRPPGTDTGPGGGYFQPSLFLIGLVFGAVVVGLGGAAVAAARQGRPARPWLWAALLIALPGSWLGPAPTGAWRTLAPGPGFGRLAEVLTGSVLVLVAMAWLTPVPPLPANAARQLRRAGGTALGVAAGLAGTLAALHQIAPPVGWLLAAGWPAAVLLGMLPARPARLGAGVLGLATTGLAALLPAGRAPAGQPAVLVTLALLALVVLAGAAVRPGDDRVPRGYPVLVALLTAGTAAAVAVYDAGWRLAPPTADYPRLALTLVVVPFTLAASAGLRVVRAPGGPRAAATVALLCGLGWLGAWALPQLPAWGPVLLALPIGAAVAGALRLDTR
jgi:hypothetical protein